MKKFGAKIGSTVEVQLEKDTSEFGYDFPEELQAVFEEDILAKQFFDALTPGKQRNLLYIVNNVKNSASRARKSLVIADHLIEQKGALDFKLLKEKIKEYNTRLKKISQKKPHYC
jgi:uncharacterized protein YdeI (YjbR/CyaY-like superfamily)